MRYFFLISFNLIGFIQQQILTENELYCYIVKVEIKNPEIVLKQAIFESGHFKSKIFKLKNNLFGFRRTSKYMSFKSWQSCVDFYKKWQDKYYINQEQNYYTFLQKKNYSGYKKYNYSGQLKKIKIRDSLICQESDSLILVPYEK